MAVNTERAAANHDRAILCVMLFVACAAALRRTQLCERKVPGANMVRDLVMALAALPVASMRKKFLMTRFAPTPRRLGMGRDQGPRGPERVIGYPGCRDHAVPMQYRGRERNTECKEYRYQQQHPGRATLREPGLFKLGLEGGFEFYFFDIRVELDRQRNVKARRRIKHSDAIAADVDDIACSKRR